MISEHAKERSEYQLAYLQQHEQQHVTTNYQDYVKLNAMGEKLQKEEKEWKQIFSGSKVAGAGNRLQLLKILSPTWVYEPERYTEWFRGYAVIDPSLQACRTGNIFEVFYRLQYENVDGAKLAGASIVLPEHVEPA